MRTEDGCGITLYKVRKQNAMWCSVSSRKSRKEKTVMRRAKDAARQAHFTLPIIKIAAVQRLQMICIAVHVTCMGTYTLCTGNCAFTRMMKHKTSQTIGHGRAAAHLQKGTQEPTSKALEAQSLNEFAHVEEALFRFGDVVGVAEENSVAAAVVHVEPGLEASLGVKACLTFNILKDLSSVMQYAAAIRRIVSVQVEVEIIVG